MKYVIYKHVYKDLDSILAEMAKLLILWVLRIFLVINPYGELIACYYDFIHMYIYTDRASTRTARFCDILLFVGKSSI